MMAAATAAKRKQCGRAHGAFASCTTMFLLVVLLGHSTLILAKNMNPGSYVIANDLKQKTKRGFNTHYRAEYFDVYSPVIRTYYSQVFWAAMDKVPLPPEIVARFRDAHNSSSDGKVMAIVGYEVDQVQVLPNGTEIPVPITHAYNHHYIASMMDSRKGRMVQKSESDADADASLSSSSRQAHTHGQNWVFEDYEKPELMMDNADDNQDNILHEQVFSEANGGEMRLSYHGYPKGYAQLIRSPDTWQINPMQVDTWNRAAGASPKFKPGPLPKISPVYNDPSATYSGLLECPCSDRIEKKWTQRYKMQATSKCQEAVQNTTECWKAGQSVVPAAHVQRYTTQGDSTRPLYCSLVQGADGTLAITWNEPPKEEDDEDCTSKSKNRLGASIQGASTTKQREEEQKQPQQVVAFASGVINATTTLKKDADDATVTLVGPKDAWFGIGFGFSTMCRHMEADECQDGGPYAVIVYEDKIEERYLDFHGKGTVLPPTIKLLSNTVSGGNRTIVLSRPIEGPDERYYSFDLEKASVPVIMAKGCNMTFAQHCGHGSSQLNFLEVGTPMQVCRDGVDDTISGRPFRKTCAAYPLSTLVEQKNPTCNLETYVGGLRCCRHLQPLLDKDQEIPWKDQLLEYQLKFRYYFEEYTPATATKKASHKQLQRFYWQTEAFAGEYDITPCRPGTPSSQCIQVITSQWSVHRMLSECKNSWCTGANSTKAEGIELIYAGPHCHAPSCLSMELYNADTGELLCSVEPIRGESPDKVYDELGYVALPPCLWGSEEEGLTPPVFLSSNTTLLSIKRNNSTIGHFGEMASWQMRGVVIMDKDTAHKEHAGTVHQMASQKTKADETADEEEEIR